MIRGIGKVSRGKYIAGKATLLRVDHMDFVIVAQNRNELAILSRRCGFNKKLKSKLIRNVKVFSSRVVEE